MAKKYCYKCGEPVESLLINFFIPWRNRNLCCNYGADNSCEAIKTENERREKVLQSIVLPASVRMDYITKDKNK